MRRDGGALAFLLLLLFFRPAQAADAAACAALGLGEAVVEAARDGVPAHCRVGATLPPAVGVEVRLPLGPAWNGRLVFVGCGGFCGAIEQGPLRSWVRAGYAAATTDGGHRSGGMHEGAWAAVAQAREDFGWRAVHVAADFARAAVAAFRGGGPARSYFVGCSNGGRQGLVAAQRFPGDFDGVLAGAPVVEWTGLGAGLLAFLAQANAGPGGRPIFPPGKVRLVAEAVARQCGDAEGLVRDPPSCRFRPASLQCAGTAGASCLTAAEVAVVEKWYAGPGPAIWPGGVPHGSEPFWPRWLTGDGRQEGSNPVLAREFVRWLAFDRARGAGFDLLRDYDLARDFAAARAPAAVYDATSPDLAGFAARGGRLLVWQGWADPITTPQRTIAWYETVQRAAGGRAGDFARLFLVPGMEHCGAARNGPGPDSTGFDPFAALLRWVEQGVAPAAIPVSKRAPDGRVRWTRPACPWPQVERGGACGDP